ncbi:MAG: hypothetical protein CMJ74_04180 [Planctomycetaceae bacterium]|nr:hypothetical protein [Planctomycetaceae bacterium]
MYESGAVPLPVVPRSTPLFRTRVLVEIVGHLLSAKATLKEIHVPLDELLQQFESHLLYDLGHTFYEEAVFENPWLTRATEALRQQQAEVENALHRLRQSAQLEKQTEPVSANFRQQFEEFIDRFSDHEASIEAFMQSVHPGHAFA